MDTLLSSSFARLLIAALVSTAFAFDRLKQLPGVNAQLSTGP
jgi:hypothetical protein